MFFGDQPPAEEPINDTRVGRLDPTPLRWYVFISLKCVYLQLFWNGEHPAQTAGPPNEATPETAQMLHCPETTLDNLETEHGSKF